MELAAALAAAAVEAVFVDLRAHGRHLKDLVALRLIRQLDMPTALAQPIGLAVHQAINFVEHGAGVSLVARLGAALALTGPALRPIAVTRTVGRRWLGRVVGIELDPLLQDHQSRLQLAKQKRLRLDDRMAFGQRLRQFGLL